MFLQVAKHIVFDLLAAIVFAAVLFATRDITLAVATGIGIGVAQFAYKKLRRHPIGPLQWLSLVIVVVLGISTIITRNPHFIMLKPSIIDFAVGVFMTTRHWMEPYLPDEVKLHVSPKTIARASKGWAAIMFFFAAANVVVAFEVGIRVWLVYATFVPTGIIALLFVAQYLFFQAEVRRNSRAAFDSRAI